MRPQIAPALAEKGKRLVNEGYYSSVSEFVNEAVRMRLEDIDYLIEDE